jgi:hypothetical protein
MPARSLSGLVCADCGTALPHGDSARRSYGWGSVAALAVAALLTTGALVLSSLSSESPTLAENRQEASQLNDSGAAE